jgi:hypothetical protein
VAERPLLCPRCRSAASVAEDTTGYIDWGPGVIGDDGVVRPKHPDPADEYQTVVSDAGITSTRGCCSNPACRHQWRLRRRFEAPESTS